MKRAPSNHLPADRRVARTQRALHEALVALILERGWDDVSIQDMCDRADVGRSTFYTHFADKEDVLLAGFAHLKPELRALSESARPLGFARPLIMHAAEHQRLFRALVGRRGGQAIHRRFREMVLELVDEDLAHIEQGPMRDATVHAVAGAFLELLTWWLDGRTALRVDDLAEAFERFCAPWAKR